MRRGLFATLEAAWRTALACRPPDVMLTFAWLAGLAEVSLRQAGAMGTRAAGGRRGMASGQTSRVAATTLTSWRRRTAGGVVCGGTVVIQEEHLPYLLLQLQVSLVYRGCELVKANESLSGSAW